MALIVGFPTFALDTSPDPGRINLAFAKLIEQIGGVDPMFVARPGNLDISNHVAEVGFRNIQKAERYSAGAITLQHDVPHAAVPMDAELAGVGLTVGDRNCGGGTGASPLQLFYTLKTGSFTVSIDGTPVGSYNLANGDWRVPGRPFMWRLSGLVSAGSRVTAALEDPVETSASGDTANPSTILEPSIPWEAVLYFRILHYR